MIHSSKGTHFVRNDAFAMTSCTCNYRDYNDHKNCYRYKCLNKVYSTVMMPTKFWYDFARAAMGWIYVIACIACIEIMYMCGSVQSLQCPDVGNRSDISCGLSVSAVS